jgi:hypothetical protein
MVLGIGAAARLAARFRLDGLVVSWHLMSSRASAPSFPGFQLPSRPRGPRSGYAEVKGLKSLGLPP